MPLDDRLPGALRPATPAFDPALAGCSVEPAEGVTLPDGEVLPATSGVVLCRVDASFGEIEVKDRPTTSVNPGHAMRARDFAEGAILGQAVEPLPEGTGPIKVLVTLR